METVVNGTEEYRSPSVKVVELEVRSNYLQALSGEGEIGENEERG